jgi:hypothetical protein
MFARRHLWGLLCWVLPAVLLSGCRGDRGPERVVVSGTVTYNGKPLSEGEIRFVPLPTCPVPVTGALIVEGRYSTKDGGGVPVGTHKIQIEARRHKAGGPNTPGPPTGSRGFGFRGMQYLPAKYNANTQLEIIIPPGSPAITKDFQLTD